MRPWRDIATEPCFKYGVFATCLERVLIHIALSEEQSWMDGWRELDGVKGSDHDIEEEDEPAVAY